MTANPIAAHDTGVICTICGKYDHRANECPRRAKFRHPGNHNWVTKALFLEQCDKGMEEFILYTLKREPTKGYPSLYQLYMELEDTTEWEFSNLYFGGWNHWKWLLEAPWFMEHLSVWRTELELKIKAKAIKAIKQEAEYGDKNRFQANKWLIDRNWITNPDGTSSHGRGRPSKQEIKQEAHRIASTTKQIDEDLERLLNGPQDPTPVH
jgi:hypothetical protein